MPGLYLLAILISAAGVATLDWRFRLAAFARPVATALAVAAGAIFFVVWDLVGIVTGTFRIGDSPHYLGVSVAPHLPVEEIAFLVFFCYLTVVVFAAFARATGGPREPHPGGVDEPEGAS